MRRGRSCVSGPVFAAERRRAPGHRASSRRRSAANTGPAARGPRRVRHAGAGVLAGRPESPAPGTPLEHHRSSGRPARVVPPRSGGLVDLDPAPPLVPRVDLEKWFSQVERRWVWNAHWNGGCTSLAPPRPFQHALHMTSGWNTGVPGVPNPRSEAFQLGIVRFIPVPDMSDMSVPKPVPKINIWNRPDQRLWESWNAVGTRHPGTSETASSRAVACQVGTAEHPLTRTSGGARGAVSGDVLPPRPVPVLLDQREVLGADVLHDVRLLQELEPAERRGARVLAR